ncbi:MAG: hypothetical protein K8F92_10270 [Hyphomicrobium sp.]|uniref:hypothetical protein n=2 Tax=Hyphomicrobium sp. TaxID=82 RepID=UPI0013293202|nr:hypothetical protein [Hyphomicrobium sp.]KAB2941742.1 MAG: hypothetical protein F9K20_08310 [Hyphomicrobium sp.]MBZ0210023.1 hypothetical protein [Hyphomicrobium sp.]
MTTIVIHGTQAHRSAVHATWWWNSWHEGGFLDAVRHGMEQASGRHDLWRVNGVPVSEVPELAAKRSLWSLSLGSRALAQHNGHFIWAGAAMGIARGAASEQLAAYLNAIHELTREPLRIIAHSHGCNIVKLASASKKLAPGVHIASAVFLACPHFFTPHAIEDYQLPYPLSPQRFGRILNVYSRHDSVQATLASHLSGQMFATAIAEMLSPTAFRVDQDPAARHLYENVELAVAADCSEQEAHTVMHGATIGGPVGAWLDSNCTFTEVLRSHHSGVLPPIPAQDYGA